MSAADSRSAPTQTLDEGPNWLVRGLLAAAVMAAVFLAREFVGSRSLRIAEAPQRVALVDAALPPPVRAEDEAKPPPPEEQEEQPQSSGEGLDDGPTLDSGPSPIDDQLGVDADAQVDSTVSGCARSAADAIWRSILASPSGPPPAAADSASTRR